MKKVYNRINYVQPEWVKKEEEKLLDAYMKDDSFKGNFEDYIRIHATPEYVKEFDMVLAM